MRYFWILAILLLAVACARTSPSKKIGNDASLQLLSLPPATLGRSLSLSQLVTGEHGGKIYKIRYELDITPERLAIVGLASMGATLFSIIQEKGKLTIENRIKRPSNLDLRYTLSDLYLTYWPSKVLNEALSRINFQFYEAPDRSVRRILSLKGDTIAEVIYSAAHQQNRDILIEHFDIPYRLRIKTVSGGDVP